MCAAADGWWSSSLQPLPNVDAPPTLQLVPALSKWGGATVGATLLAIGAMGLYETFFEQHEDEAHAERDPAAEALTGEAPLSWVARAFACVTVWAELMRTPGQWQPQSKPRATKCGALTIELPSSPPSCLVAARSL